MKKLLECYWNRQGLMALMYLVGGLAIVAAFFWGCVTDFEDMRPVALGLAGAVVLLIGTTLERGWP